MAGGQREVVKPGPQAFMRQEIEDLLPLENTRPHAISPVRLHLSQTNL
jgi:hypothetical protein